MKIVVLSDTHNFTSKNFHIPDGDVIIHAGDFTGMGRTNEVSLFLNWYSKLPHSCKIIIAGNHDFMYENYGSLARRMTEEHGIIYLEDDYYIHKGIKIYGSPWQPQFCDWAFNLKRGKPLREKWNLIPEDTDILVTHGPPLGILDKTRSKINVGCEELLRRVTEINPYYHIFGHIHEGYGTVRQNNITFMNVSICNYLYKPVNKCKSFDV